MTSIKEKIEHYVEDKLNKYVPLEIRAPKIIHDTILGSNMFEPHEIAILDTPIIQRLRRINQVDVVPLVFPSGNHNRFEHTLGVTVISGQLVTALYNKFGQPGFRENKIVTEIKGKYSEEYVRRHVRIAAIMHDCGHGPFSHMSELVYKELEDIKEEKKKNPRFAKAAYHEILSYYIITSNAFKDFFEANINAKYKIEVDLDFVGDIVIGYIDRKADLMRAFMVGIVNGAFDADKLDYIQRDSHFTGIKMVLDLHRLFHTLDIIKDENDIYRLCVDLSGVSTLEQIVFNKMMLFSTVYHHHKVRAAECLFRSLFEELVLSKYKIFDKDFSSASDYLYITDDDIFALTRQDMGIVSSLASDIYYRRLPKRALVISTKTIDISDGPTQEAKIKDIMNKCDDVTFIRLLREAISEKTVEYGSQIPVEEIWVDIPKGPNFNEVRDWPVKVVGEDKEYIRLRDIFPVDDWARAFSQNKWKGYVFTRPEHRKSVSKAAKEVISNMFKIELKQQAIALCKMDTDEDIDK